VSSLTLLAELIEARDAPKMIVSDTDSHGLNRGINPNGTTELTWNAVLAWSRDD
jgi:hypothetical protein